MEIIFLQSEKTEKVWKKISVKNIVIAIFFCEGQIFSQFRMRMTYSSDMFKTLSIENI